MGNPANQIFPANLLSAIKASGAFLMSFVLRSAQMGTSRSLNLVFSVGVECYPPGRVRTVKTLAVRVSVWGMSRRDLGEESPVLVVLVRTDLQIARWNSPCLFLRLCCIVLWPPWNTVWMCAPQPGHCDGCG